MEQVRFYKKVVKAKIQHTCNDCYRQIAKGENYTRLLMTNDIEDHRMNLCFDCEPILENPDEVNH